MSPSQLDFLKHILHECEYVIRVSQGKSIVKPDIQNRSKPSPDNKIFLYILCIAPPIAVFLAVNRHYSSFMGAGPSGGSVKSYYVALAKAALALLLTCLFWIPGIIYAIHIVKKSK